MHPVLKVSLEPLSRTLEGLTMEEAQIEPQPGKGRWCAQQVVEHLILTYGMTVKAVSRHLKSNRAAKKDRGPIISLLRMHDISLGRMPSGVPAVREARPKEFTPMDGLTLGERLFATAEEMDRVLVQARRKFGVEPCGEHWFYGGLRVDEWRRYHAVHARHHVKQLKAAIQYARLEKGNEPKG